MKKILFVAGITFNSILFCQTTFQKEYGGSGDEGGTMVRQTSDGGFVILGSKDQTGSSNKINIIKTDSNGNTQWTKILGGGGPDFGFCIQQTHEGGYIIAGQARNLTSGNRNCCLIRLDASGGLIWSQLYGNMTYSEAYYVQELSDNGFVFVGRTSTRLVIVRTDSTGALVWSNHYVASSYIFGQNIQLTHDGGLIVTGAENTLSTSDDILLLKLDMNGTLLWSRTYGGAQIDIGYAVRQTSDRGFIITGETHSSVNRNPFLLKTDSTGVLQWVKSYGGSSDDWGYSVDQTVDGGYFLTGTSTSYGIGINNMYVLKTDSAGNHVWSNTFGGTGNDFGYYGEPTNDGGYIMTGYSNVGTSTRDIYVVKANALGLSGCNELVPLTSTVPVPLTMDTLTVTYFSSGTTTPVVLAQTSGNTQTYLCLTVEVESVRFIAQEVFPNPSTGQVVFSGLENESKIEIFNLTGQAIYQTSSNNETETIDISDKAKGMYFYRVMNDGKLAGQGKLIVE